MNTNNTIQPFVIQTMAMNLSEVEALSYLKDRGYSISRESYYRYKRKIAESRFDRLSLIAKQRFVDQHLERIAQLESINKEYWSLYRKEKDTFKKAQILEKIAELQTYFSPYYDASRYVMEKSIKDEQTKKSESISS